MTEAVMHHQQMNLSYGLCCCDEVSVTSYSMLREDLDVHLMFMASPQKTFASRYNK